MNLTEIMYKPLVLLLSIKNIHKQMKVTLKPLDP